MSSETILFDADRDNHGKGIRLDDMINMLKKIRQGQEKTDNNAASHTTT